MRNKWSRKRLKEDFSRREPYRSCVTENHKERCGKYGWAGRSLPLPFTHLFHSAFNASWTIFDRQLNLIFCFFHTLTQKDKCREERAVTARITKYCPRGNDIIWHDRIFSVKRNKDWYNLLNEELKLEHPDVRISKPLFVLLHYSGNWALLLPFSFHAKCFAEEFSDYKQLPLWKAPIIPPVAYLSS